MIIHRLSIYGYIEGGTITWSVGKGGGAISCQTVFCVLLRSYRAKRGRLVSPGKLSKKSRFDQLSNKLIYPWFGKWTKYWQIIDILVGQTAEDELYKSYRIHFYPNKWISKFLTEIIGRVYLWIYCQSDQTKITDLLWL